MTFDEEKVCGANECMKMLKDRLPNLTNMYTFHGDEHVTAWSIQLTLDHLSLYVIFIAFIFITFFGVCSPVFFQMGASYIPVYICMYIRFM